MHNIKELRENINKFKKSIMSRNVKVDLDIILNLDIKNRKLIQEKENLEKQKKDISKAQDKKLFVKSKEISVINKSKEVENVSKHIANTVVIKNIYIKNKLVNFITKK